LLLVDEPELVGDRVVVRGRRADHLRAVLAVAPGRRVRVGVVGGPIGHGEVIAVAAEAIEVRVELGGPPPPPLPLVLILAVPRPKVLARALEIAAAFAVERIELVNAWRVDKAYFGSPRLAPAALAECVRLGAEQGVTTHVPPVRVHARLMGYLDEHHPPGAASGGALCAHPRAPQPIERAATALPPTVLAIGPEGGWIERELETFAARGFALVSLGDAVLRTEAAVAGALAQLALLARVRTSGAPGVDPS
jgi:RsmE family RNA methyltransferase